MKRKKIILGLLMLILPVVFALTSTSDVSAKATWTISKGQYVYKNAQGDVVEINGIEYYSPSDQGLIGKIFQTEFQNPGANNKGLEFKVTKQTEPGETSGGKTYWCLKPFNNGKSTLKSGDCLLKGDDVRDRSKVLVV